MHLCISSAEPQGQAPSKNSIRSLAALGLSFLTFEMGRLGCTTLTSGVLCLHLSNGLILNLPLAG